MVEERTRLGTHNCSLGACAVLAPSPPMFAPVSLPRLKVQADHLSLHAAWLPLPRAVHSLSTPGVLRLTRKLYALVAKRRLFFHPSHVDMAVRPHVALSHACCHVVLLDWRALFKCAAMLVHLPMHGHGLSSKLACVGTPCVYSGPAMP
jgi:hypothetical protein